MKDRIKELKHQIEVTTNEYNDHWNEAMDLQRLLRNYEGDLIRLQRIDNNNLESEGEWWLNFLIKKDIHYQQWNF